MRAAENLGRFTVDTSYTYTPDNRLTQRNGDPTNIAYDPTGNQTSYPATAALPGNTTVASPQASTQYDTANHSTIVTSAGTPVTMTYLNPDQNQRITAGGTYYGTGVLGVSYQTTNAATTAFTRTPGGGLVSMRTGSGSMYYLTDNQGSVIGLVDGQGQKVAGYSYTPYGETRTITGTPAGDLTQANSNPYRYTSGYLDATSNLYKLGYRYYDPNQGRFTQQDPSGQEQNSYLYAGGNPINQTDPTGTIGTPCDLGTIGIVTGLGALGLAQPEFAVPIFAASTGLGAADYLSPCESGGTPNYGNDAAVNAP